ncbi:hypothetical protein M2169_003973 [Streptomyces sp. MJP52]|nr:hypothetical protein [Streptomyces sp. MJP52]
MPLGPGPHRRGVVGETFLRAVLLEAGSLDERLVEDDGSVLVLVASRGAVGRAVGWLSGPAHTFRVGCAAFR